MREIWDRDWAHVEVTPETAARAIKVYTELAGDLPAQKTAVDVEGDFAHVLAAIRPTLGLPGEELRRLPRSLTSTPLAVLPTPRAPS